MTASGVASPEPIQGLLVVDKPAGPTSHDVVARVRRVSGVRRVGHAGTLDPMATGVVVVALGRATRLLRYVQDSTKEYVATMRMGIATDTLDAEGTETWRRPMAVTAQQVEQALVGFRGWIDQVPPMVSALKVEGRRLYELARAGEEVERAPRAVHVERLQLVEFSPGEHPTAVIEVVCSKGTYIRVLADDIARTLGGRAHLSALRRTRVDGFTIDQSIALADVDGWRRRLLPSLAAVAGMEKLDADESQMAMVAQGRTLQLGCPPGPVALVGPGGLLAVYRVDGTGVARAEVVLA